MLSHPLFLKRCFAVIAVLLLPVEVTAAEIIVDNGKPGTTATGTWWWSALGNYYGTRSLYSREPGAKYDYVASIPQEQNYDLYAYWLAYASRNTQAPIKVSHLSGVSTVYVDQTQNGGEWRYIGTYRFKSSAKITIESNSSTMATSVDAIKLIPKPTAPLPSVTADKTATLSWWSPTLDVSGKPLTNLAGHLIYMSKSAGRYSRSDLVKTVIAKNARGGDPNSYTTPALAPGTYYFRVVVFSSTGQESLPSAEVYKTIK